MLKTWDEYYIDIMGCVFRDQYNFPCWSVLLYAILSPAVIKTCERWEAESACNCGAARTNEWRLLLPLYCWDWMVRIKGKNSSSLPLGELLNHYFVHPVDIPDLTWEHNFRQNVCYLKRIPLKGHEWWSLLTEWLVQVDSKFNWQKNGCGSLVACTDPISPLSQWKVIARVALDDDMHE